MRFQNIVIVRKHDHTAKLKIFFAGHCGISGRIRAEFTWHGLVSDIQEFVEWCIHCLVTRTKRRVPRPLVEKFRTKYCIPFIIYMCESISESKYLLAIREDVSALVWLFPFEKATSESAAEALISWLATFGIIDWLLWDQGAHFKK